MLEQRTQLLRSFSKRLTEILVAKGYASQREDATVRVKELSIAADCSYQMARKYVLGTAFPDYGSVQKIASWLNVSPGWLLFGEGEKSNNSNLLKNTITLDKGTVEYIFTKLSPLWVNCFDPDEMVKFAVDIFYDASHIKAEKEMIFKVIDVAIGSAKRFLHTKVPLNKAK